MLRVQFEEDLEKLHVQFYAMGNEVLSQITAWFGCCDHDRELGPSVIEDDAETSNEYEAKLERKSLRLSFFNSRLFPQDRVVMTVLKQFLIWSGWPRSIDCQGNDSHESGKVRIQSAEGRNQQDGPWSQRFCRSDTRCLPLKARDLAYEAVSWDEVINHYFDSIQELAAEEIRKNPESIDGRDYFQVINLNASRL